MQLRTLHAYVGMLIAPSVLFMAATGLLQVYSLHEDHGAYHAPAALKLLGSLHKDQKLPAAKGGPDHDHDQDAARNKAEFDGLLKAGAHSITVAGPNTPAPEADHDDMDTHKPAHPWAVALLKAVFAAVAVGLFASTCVGIWMAWQNRLQRRTNMILLGVGALVPLVLAFLAG